MSFKTRLLFAALPAMALMYGAPALAQDAAPCFTSTTTTTDGVTSTTTTGGIDTETTTPLQTSTANNGEACDVRVQGTGSIDITAGTAITVDSDNAARIEGSLTSTDVNDTTGVELQGGNSGRLFLTGTIDLSETTENTDTDSDFTPDGDFAEGSGRTGILISGAAPFVGNVTASTTSTINIDGNDSYAMRVLEAASITGDINLNGTIRVIGGIARDASGNPVGGASAGLLVEGTVDGDINQAGSLTSTGEGVRGIDVSGNVTGGITNGGTINNTGYRFVDRGTNLALADAIDASDTLQAGSAIYVAGNVGEGVHLQREETFDENGISTGFEGSSILNHAGSAPAILFDGNGTNIMIGMIVPVTDTDRAHLQYAFVNQGTVTANAVFDDLSAVGLEVRDATLEGGISNSGSMNVETFRSSSDGDANTSLSRVVVLGSGAIVDEINNSGIMVATVTENAGDVFADIDNPLAPQDLIAVAIDVEANANITSIVNSGAIRAALVGREGTAVAIRDASGTLTVINNSGAILATGQTSDPVDNSDTDFTLIALDLTANTTGVTINQTVAVDTDPNDGFTPASPIISGDVLLGSGDDTVNLEAGGILGDLDFADGADTLSLSGGSTFQGTLTDTGDLVISVVENSSLIQTTATPINATSASFDGTSTFSPTLSGQSGLASTIITSGDITFGQGATIAPILTDVVDQASNTFTILDAGGTLSIGNELDSLLSFTSPFLYDTTFQIDPNNPNALLITLDLRDTAALGLDNVQNASFASAYDALFGSQELAQAFVNITDGTEFRRGLNQLLPEFASAARHFVVANVDGAVGAVGSHLDNARRSQEQSGGAWVQEFTYFADRALAGLSEQFRGFGFGFTGGFDTAMGPFHTAGVNIGFASTEIEDVGGFDDPMNVITLQGGLYAGFETGDFSLDLYGGGGYNNFEQTRNVSIGNFTETTDGDWSGSHINGSIRGGYDIELNKKLWMRPAFSVDYLRLMENAYSETSALTNSAIALSVDDRTSELAGATAMLNIGGNFEGRRTWIRPSLRVGYRNEFINDGVVTTYGFSGRELRSTLISEAFPSEGVLLGFSLAAGTGYSSFGFDFDSDVRDGFIRHTGRIVLRMIF